MNVDDELKLYEQAKSDRTPFEHDWRMGAARCLPREFGLWRDAHPSTSAAAGGIQSARREQVDTTALLALPKYVAVLDKMLTPATQRWHALVASRKELMKQQRVKEYFYELNNILWQERYDPRAHFISAQTETYSSLGVYGNGVKFLGERRAYPWEKKTGLFYRHIPLTFVFVLLDDEGRVARVYRQINLNARQAASKFGDAIPECVRAELQKSVPSESETFEFVHVVYPNEKDYDPRALDERRHKWASVYLCVKDKVRVGKADGYSSFPFQLPRAFTTGSTWYGYSPYHMASGAIGGANATKRIMLRQGQKAVDPPLLAHDDGVLSSARDMRPGHINPGTLDHQGRELLKPMRPGEFRPSETILADDRGDIRDAFFVNLFQILMENPRMTATEVLEKAGERAALLSPTMGRMQAEDLGPMLEREIDLLARMGRLPEMPPELKEAEGEYEVVYTSPMAKSLRADAAAGFMRTVEFAGMAAQQKQDPALMDRFDFDEAIPEIAEIQGVPPNWIRSDQEMEADRQARAKQAQGQQLLDAAPGLAGAAKQLNEMGAPA